jgi:tRNA (adenine57-N1/adenine58-N1)-methyltransferase
MPTQEGDFVLIQVEDKRFLKRITKDFNLNYKKRTLKFEDVVGKEFGTSVNGFYLLKPNLEAIILYGFKRKTQIIYPKDAFYIAFKLGINKSSTVLEFGIGSGALTAVLSELAGRVVAYEVSPEFYKNALKNWDTFGLCKNVEAINQDFMDADLSGPLGLFCKIDSPLATLFLSSQRCPFLIVSKGFALYLLVFPMLCKLRNQTQGLYAPPSCR